MGRARKTPTGAATNPSTLPSFRAQPGISVLARDRTSTNAVISAGPFRSAPTSELSSRPEPLERAAGESNGAQRRDPQLQLAAAPHPTFSAGNLPQTKPLPIISGIFTPAGFAS